MKIPTLPPTAALPEFVAFGDCEKGQTAAKTGCTPEEGGGTKRVGPSKKVDMNGAEFSDGLKDAVIAASPRSFHEWLGKQLRSPKSFESGSKHSCAVCGRKVSEKALTVDLNDGGERRVGPKCKRYAKSFLSEVEVKE